MGASELLNTPVERLGLSENFYERCNVMGFSTIADILKVAPMDLVNKTGFSYTWLGELSEFLQKQKLLHLLQPAPGKNYD
jgi:hypothetical protein